MGSKFSIGEQVKLNDGKFTGAVDAIWVARGDSTQYLVVWWDGGHRHQQWLREHELTT